MKEAFESNYIAPLGPQVDAFEQEFADYVGIKHCVVVSSGTAAMHLSLRHLGVMPGVREKQERDDLDGWMNRMGDDSRVPEVFASTLTFIGSVTPVVFEGASPVFIDCDRESWNMDPGLLEAELERCVKKGKLIKAVIPTDLYGQCCDLPKIVDICDRYGVPVVCDSAEALGGRFLAQRRKDAKGKDGWMNGGVDEKTDFGPVSSDIWRHAGAGARAAVFSFNGNKIMTTSGGGMLASDDEDLIVHAKKLSQQAREDFPHYEHVEIGFNYRMSNVPAAIGRGQLRVLDERVKRKREP